MSCSGGSLHLWRVKGIKTGGFGGLSRAPEGVMKRYGIVHAESVEEKGLCSG
jgi:hypothetical protein